MTSIPPPQNPIGVADPQQSMMDSIVAASVDRDEQAQGLMDSVVRARSEEAQTAGEVVGWQVAAGAKVLGDSIANIASLSARVAGGLMSATRGQGFSAGYESIGGEIEDAFGSEQPSILDVMAAVDPFGDNSGIHVGDAADKLIQKRLGRSAVIGQTIGHIASFATGPSKAIGSAVQKASGPLSRWAQRAATKAIAGKGAGEAILKQGRIWDYVAGTPKWKQVLARAGGRWVGESIDTGAMLAAQAYAMGEDEDRLSSMGAMALMAPFMVPIAKLGQGVASKVASLGVTREQAAKITQGLRDMESGKISIDSLDELIKANTSTAMRGAANYIVAPALEGTAFMGLDENARGLLQKGLSGDEEAWADLAMIWLGTAAGIAVTKYGAPIDGIAFLKTIRPDLNRLSIYAEAEASKKVDNWREEPDMVEKDRQRQGPVSEKDRATIQSSEEKLKQAVDALDVMWAEIPADAAIKSGWEPSFPNSGVVELNHNGFSMRMKRQGVTGDIDLRLSPDTEAALKDFGVDVPSGVMSGLKAIEAIGQVTMLSTLRSAHGALLFDRMGYREVGTGLWVNPANGRYYSMRLDGKIASKEALQSKWTEVEDVQAVGVGGEVRWSNETSQALQRFIIQKQAQSPDPLVDGILSLALIQAQSGNSAASDQVRAYLGSRSLGEIIAELKPGTDRSLAITLGRLASGHTNSREALMSGDREMVERMTDGRDDGKAPVTDEQIVQDIQNTIAEELKRENPDMPSGESGGIAIPSKAELEAMVADAKRSGKLTAKGVSDYIFRSAYEILSREVPESSFPREMQEIDARGEYLSGQAGSGVRKMKQSAGSREGRRFLRERIKGSDYTLSKGSEIPDDFEYSAARLAASKLIEPGGSSKAEKESREGFVAGTQEALLRSWSDARNAGTTRDENGKTVPIPEIESSVVPFRPGRDVEAVMAQESLRIPYFKGLAAAHPERMVPVTKEVVNKKSKRRRTVTVMEGPRENQKPKMRRETWEDINERYLEKVRSLGGARESLDAKQATEFVREYRHRPDWFRGYEMLEPNITKIVDEAVRSQSKATAFHERYGQDVENRAAAIKSLKGALEEPGADVEAIQRAIDNLNRGGSSRALSSFFLEAEAAMRSRGDIGYLSRVGEIARHWIQRAQASEPITMSKPWKVLASYARYASPVLAVKSGLYDIPDMFIRGATYFGGAPTLRAFASVARSPREMVHYYEDVGAMTRASGDLAIEEASGPLQSMADKAAAPSQALERFKGALSGKLADIIIARFKDKTAPEGYHDVARSDLKLDTDTLAEIRSGEMSSATIARLRRGITSLLTSRQTSSEASSFGSDPRITAIVPFRKFFTARIPKVYDVVAALARSKDAAEFGRNAWKTSKLALGITGGGLAAQALALTLSEFFKSGDPTRGARVLWSRLNAGPLGTVARAGVSQVVGGPFASAAEALLNPDSASRWANLTHPTRLARSLALGVSSAVDGDWQRAWDYLLADTGAVPMAREGRHVVTLAAAAMHAENTGIVQDIRFVEGILRDAGVTFSYGTRNKPDEFYEALGEIVKIASRTDIDDKQKIAESHAALQTALGLTTSDRLASAVSAQQVMAKLSDAQRRMVSDQALDDGMMERLYQHDSLLRRMAKRIREDMRGTYVDDWGGALEEVKNQAAMGAGDRWNDLTDRAMDEAINGIIDGDGEGAHLKEVSDAMGSFPDQLDQVFGIDEVKRLASITDSAVRSRRIYSLLRRRLRIRVSRERKARRSKMISEASK